MRAHGIGIREQFDDFVRSRAGRDIIVTRCFPEKLIADTASCKQRLIPAFLKRADNGDGSFFHGKSQGIRMPRSAAVTLRIPPCAVMSSKCHHSDSIVRNPTDRIVC